MQRQDTSRRTRAAILAAVALPVVSGVLFWTTGLASAHGGDATKVHACVVPASGTIRIVGAEGTCEKNETALDWTRNAGATYSAGFGLALSPGNEFSVTGAPWGGLTGVPAGFLDNSDDDGSQKVQELKTSLSGSVGHFDPFRINGAWIAEGTIAGWHIADGSIHTPALAGDYQLDYSTGRVQEAIVGAVTSEKIADGTIEARDLGRGLAQRLADLENTIAALEARITALEAE